MGEGGAPDRGCGTATEKSPEEQRNVPTDQIRALKDRTGVYKLMGSAADRVSDEATRFEQALMTCALLRGMKGAVLYEDAYVDVGRLFNYVFEEVRGSPRTSAVSSART